MQLGLATRSNSAARLQPFEPAWLSAVEHVIPLSKVVTIADATGVFVLAQILITSPRQSLLDAQYYTIPVNTTGFPGSSWS